MNIENKTVETSIYELEDYLSGAVEKTILNKGKLHITAPVGTHKTSFILREVDLYPGKQFIFLLPQVGLATQIFHKTKNHYTPAFVYNSKTFRHLEKWEEQNHSKWPFTYLSTIDSAWRLFEEEKVDPTKTVVVVDETHSFLQTARENFDKTVLAIREAGVPVIGFTATQSTWVMKYLLGIDQVINIEAIDLPPKRIVPVKVGRGMPATIANMINKAGWKRLVVWTENKKDQVQIALAIQTKLPGKTISVLNADTRESSEKASWNYLMQNHKIQPGTDVLIMNSVGQAGININDDDFDAVLLVGKFDPFGFLQYLGRCRKYTGYYYFLHHNYGKQTSLWPGADKMEDYLIYVQKELDKYPDKEFSSIMEITRDPDYYMKLPNGKIVLKKCMVANKIYDRFRDVNGTELLKTAEIIDPTIVIEEGFEVAGVKPPDTSAQKAVYRRKKKTELSGLVKKNAKYLKSMAGHYEEGMTHADLLELIDNASSDRKDVKKNVVLYIPKTCKVKLAATVTTAKNAGVTVTRLLFATEKYVSEGNSEKILKKLLNMGDRKYQQLENAYYFFKKDHQNKPIVKTILDDFSDKTSERKEEGGWIEMIHTYFNNMPGTYVKAKRIYQCCFIIKDAKLKVNGKRKNRKELVKVVRTYDDYKKESRIDI